MGLTVRTISREEHRGHLALSPTTSLLQTPAWGLVKEGWSAESVGWFDAASGALRGTALVLYRQAPGTRRSLAYLPEGPAADWFLPDLVEARLRPLLDHVRRCGAFAVRMGPPVAVRHWEAHTVEAALGDPSAGRARRLGEVPADFTDARALALAERLRAMGWRPAPDEATKGFGIGQPRHTVQVALAGREPEELRSGLGEEWRQGVETAEKHQVRVGRGGADDLPAFHALYARDTRNGGRSLAYFRRMWDALNADDGDRLRMHVAEHDGRALAAALTTVSGPHVRQPYSGPAVQGLERRPDHALHWRMLSDAHASGAEVYDLRGVTDVLDASDGALDGLRFKIGSGGRVVEHLGEWEFSLGRMLHKALGVYLSRR
ncbi:lipid II:glycine glycyltransferase FemX [Streptomyces sp. NPDC060194]|uniref:lipid II:glycine glycyltransferase FemX n=1 Tax=Streptomyces sp. NPDC060194 TaxID=3347069 RepID=UPI003650E808